MRRETYKDGVLVSAEDMAPAVPDAVSARQLKRALLDAGLYDAVDQWVAQQPKAVQIDWKHAQEFARSHPMLLAAATSFGMTTEQIDALFIAAAKVV